ncbi:thioredoxin family protein [Jannaschia sp. Os4]|uniref:SoxW family protein n=1 Tax=Jannaschia sp. Os4 TaxID=2807617 RepID=UPI001939A503|nr:thioredoxin family protein [Jannaschia sp. Os4]MBM2576320.1 thioredoxin family protein [Jannaschia sp. Os4]
MIRRTLIAAALAFAAAPVPAATVGDDGLHDAPWIRETFLDLREDLAEANAEGKRMLVVFEQRGCIYCTRMHEEVFPHPRIESLLSEDFFVVQLNLHGDLEVVDFDGESLSEKEMARKWGILFTPTMMFLPQEVGEVPAPQAAVASMPGAFGRETTFDLLHWVLEEGYADTSEEDFQRYHARRFLAREEAGDRLSD